MDYIYSSWGITIINKLKNILNNKISKLTHLTYLKPRVDNFVTNPYEIIFNNICETNNYNRKER